MNDPYARSGARTVGAAPATWHGAVAAIAACIGGGATLLGAVSGINLLRGLNDLKLDAAKDIDTWLVTRHIRVVQENLLVVSALLAVVLIVGGILLLLGKPAGRESVLIGAGWGFFGGLLAATYGNQYGLSAETPGSPLFLIVGAALSLIALVTVGTSPLGRRATAPAPPQSLPRPSVPQFGHQAPAPPPGYQSSQPGYQPPAPQLGHQAPAPQPGHFPPASQPGPHH
ncbi:hypothetical protein [Nocardia sp. SC052]|uniref:hypothetical protein n=1 Tax=Nocardia sichangensis TaxID=3385975 RepID=UPI00399F407B